MTVVPHMTDEEWIAYTHAAGRRRAMALTPARWEPVLKQVCAKHKLHQRDVLGVTRSKHIMAARHEFWFRLSSELNASFGEIGRVLGRNHTSIRHGVMMHVIRAALIHQEGRQ